MLYTDGIALTKSNSHEFWPVFIGLVELPPSIRDSLKNKCIAGVWFGKTKPTSSILFDNLFNEVIEINKTGLIITPPSNYNNDDSINYKFLLDFYGFIADTPGKNEMLNKIGHNGYYGCPYCLIEGINKWNIKIFKFLLIF
jgi:hypothetical protein